MKTHFITFSTISHRHIADLTTAAAEQSGQFDSVTGYTREHLEATEFYRNNNKILDKSRYAGYCLWKPFFIFEKMKEIDEGDIIVYIDCCDSLHEAQNLREFLLTRMKETDLLLTAGAFPNYQYTKKDAFVLMECDNEDYWNDIQVEAGIVVVKKTPLSAIFIQDWLSWCRDERIVTDLPNTCGLPNPGVFIDHRADQSVLSLLAKKFNIDRTNEMRRFVHCNTYFV